MCEELNTLLKTALEKSPTSQLAALLMGNYVQRYAPHVTLTAQHDGVVLNFRYINLGKGDEYFICNCAEFMQQEASWLVDNFADNFPDWLVGMISIKTEVK